MVAILRPPPPPRHIAPRPATRRIRRIPADSVAGFDRHLFVPGLRGRIGASPNTSVVTIAAPNTIGSPSQFHIVIIATFSQQVHKQRPLRAGFSGNEAGPPYRHFCLSRQHSLHAAQDRRGVLSLAMVINPCITIPLAAICPRRAATTPLPAKLQVTKPQATNRTAITILGVVIR